MAATAELLASRSRARAELVRVCQERASQLAAILQVDLAPEDKAALEAYLDGLVGPLGQAWREFLRLPLPAQLEAVAGSGYRGMPWHSLLQCNPYTMTSRWVAVTPRLV